MNLTSFIKRNLSKRRLATAVCISASVAAFAALGDVGLRRTPSPKQCLLGFKPDYNHLKTFTLKSTYNYRGNTVFSLDKPEEKYVLMNTFVTYQKGNITYTLPLKKKVLLNKVKLGTGTQSY
jgi:hypothetical protein